MYNKWGLKPPTLVYFEEEWNGNQALFSDAGLYDTIVGYVRSLVWAESLCTIFQASDCCTLKAHKMRIKCWVMLWMGWYYLVVCRQTTNGLQFVPHACGGIDWRCWFQME